MKPKAVWTGIRDAAPPKGDDEPLFVTVNGIHGIGVICPVYYMKPLGTSELCYFIKFTDGSDSFLDIPTDMITAWMKFPKPYQENKSLLHRMFFKKEQLSRDEDDVENKWTKLEDGRPPIDTPLIVTMKDGQSKRVCSDVYYRASMCSGRCSWNYEPIDFNKVTPRIIPESEIIAWMEYPEPYTGEGNEEQGLKKMSF